MPAVIILPALFATVGFVVWTVATTWQRSRHVRELTQFHARVIDRMGSIRDFSEFLQTPGGMQFMNAITADGGPTGPRERILRAVQTGIVLTSLSIGFLLLSAGFHPAPVDKEGLSDLFMVLGVSLMSLGIGFVVAAGASYGLSRRLGVLEPVNHRPGADVSSR